MRAGLIIIGLVCFIYIAEVDSKEVTPANKEVTVTLNSKVELKWTISSDITITAIGIFIETRVPANEIIIGTGGGILVTTIGKTRYGDRISAETNNKEVVVKLQNVQLNDTNYVFIINVLEFKDNKATQFGSEIKLIVQGGPIFCADQIPATRTYNENATPAISVTVCGIPKPTVTWKLGASSLPGGVSINSSTQSHGYDYSITLPNLTPSMCGKQLLLQADGYSGKVTAALTLDIEFTPESITDVQFYTGNCNVTYTVQYTNSSGSIIATENNLVQASHRGYNSREGSSVKVWATYNGKQGPASVGTTLQIITTTTTTTTTPTTITTTTTATTTTSTTTTRRDSSSSL